ncbi:MAG: GH12 family glycosyl hydrolase domain-containing protein [Kineosporiaceae bacterium]
MTSSPTSAPAPAGHVCTSPVFRTSDPNGGWSEGGYYVHNNMWNIAKYPSLKETLEACSHASWNVTATADNSSGNGEVKSYPNVHVDYHGSGANGEPAWSSFKTMRSTFAAKGSGVGIYDVAYDIWMNGVPGNREIMIWTENHNQRPAGNVVATVSLSGITWDVWATGNNSYLAFTPKSPLASGSLDPTGMIDYLVSQGRVPANSTLGQIGFGVEIVSTEGKPATFQFTDFSVTSS